MKLSKYLYNKVIGSEISVDRDKQLIKAHLYLCMNSKDGHIEYNKKTRRYYTIFYNGRTRFEFRFEK